MMKSALKKFTFLILVCIISSSASAKPEALYNTIKQMVNKQAGGDVNFGIYVKNLETDKVEFAIHPTRLFMPASTTKLFTAYTALNYLGSDYKFKTSLMTKRPSDGGVISGDLYIKFVGDPSFTYEDLKSLFASAGITKIKGNVVVDDSMMDSYRNAVGGFTWDNQPFCYAAPVSAIIIDKNCCKAWMKPSVIGKQASLNIERPYVLSIANTVETVAPRKSECPYKSRYIGNNKYEVYGCMFNDSQAETKLNFAMPDNHLMAKEYIRKALEETRIKLKGDVIIGKANAAETIVVATHESSALEDILSVVLQDSCNLSSAALFKHVAAKYTGAQGTDSDGEVVMRNFLLNQGLDSRTFRIREGAGESRYNLIAPKALVDLLAKIYRSKSRDVFISHMPQYSTNGTLKHRSVDNPNYKYIYAKTGTLDHTSSLAGLYLPPKGAKYAFAIMFNNYAVPNWDVKVLEDKILGLLVRGVR